MNASGGFENELNYSPLHQLELQMALSNGGITSHTRKNIKESHMMATATATATTTRNGSAAPNGTTSLGSSADPGLHASLATAAYNSKSSNHSGAHMDGESIYSFDSVSTNGRLLDRLDLDNDDFNDDDEDEEAAWARRSSYVSVQSTGRLLDRLGLDEDKTAATGIASWVSPLSRASSTSKKSSSSLLSLGSLSRRKSSRKHIPISTNSSSVGLNRAPSAPTISAPFAVGRSLSSSKLPPQQQQHQQHHYQEAPPKSQQSQSQQQQQYQSPDQNQGQSLKEPPHIAHHHHHQNNHSSPSIDSASTGHSGNEYTIGNVESGVVQSEINHDNKSIFSFQADMASLESVATISQKIPTPFSSPITRQAIDYASKRDTVDMDMEYEDFDVFTNNAGNPNRSVVSDYPSTGTQHLGGGIAGTSKYGHRHTNSLPEPNLDQSPQRQQQQQQQLQRSGADELDDFQFTSSGSSSPVPQHPTLLRMQTEPTRPPSSIPSSASTSALPTQPSAGSRSYSASHASSNKQTSTPRRSSSKQSSQVHSHHHHSPSLGDGRRIVSDPVVSRSASSSSISLTSPTKYPKQDMTPEARTALAIQLRNTGNHREASYQLQLAANMPNNYPKAMYLYALALRYGQGVKLNERNSLKWLLRCLLVIQNDSSSSSSSGGSSSGGGGSSSQNDYVSKLVDIGPDDLVRIMNSYISKEPEIDPVLLYDYYSKLPQAQLAKLIQSVKSQSNVIASTHHEVGNCLLNGAGLSNRDEAMGIVYLSKAASMGNVSSMTQLGELWSSKSKYHKKDYFKASAWLRLSELFGTKSIGNSWIYKDKYIKAQAK